MQSYYKLLICKKNSTCKKQKPKHNKVSYAGIGKLLVLPNLIYGSQCSPIKIIKVYFVDVNKLILKIR